MSSRPSSFKAAGGKFNGKTATFVGYEFEVKGPYEIKKGERAGSSFSKLFLKTDWLIDGADVPTTKLLEISRDVDQDGLDDVSEDLLTLNTSNGQRISQIREAGIFLASMVHPEEGEGFPEDRLSDDDDFINLEPMVGTRVELVTPENQWAKDNNKTQKGSDGKDYKIYDFKVQRVLELPKVAGKTSKTAAKPTLVKGKPAPAPEPEDDSEAIQTAASAAFARYIAKEPKKVIAVSALRMKVVTDSAFKKDAELRDAIIEIAEDVEKIAELTGVEFADSKKKTLKIAA